MEQKSSIFFGFSIIELYVRLDTSLSSSSSSNAEEWKCRECGYINRRTATATICGTCGTLKPIRPLLEPRLSYTRRSPSPVTETMYNRVGSPRDQRQSRCSDSSDEEQHQYSNRTQKQKESSIYSRLNGQFLLSFNLNNLFIILEFTNDRSSSSKEGGSMSHSTKGKIATEYSGESYSTLSKDKCEENEHQSAKNNSSKLLLPKERASKLIDQSDHRPGSERITIDRSQGKYLFFGGRG